VAADQMAIAEPSEWNIPPHFFTRFLRAPKVIYAFRMQNANQWTPRNPTSYSRNPIKESRRCCCCAGDVAAVAAVAAAPAAADDDDKCSLQRNRKVATMCVCVTDDNDR